MTTTPAERDAVSRIPDTLRRWMPVVMYHYLDGRECVECKHRADTECMLGFGSGDEPQDCPGAEFEV